MVYWNSWSLGLVLWSCGLGKRDISSLSFLYPSVFILFSPTPLILSFLSCSLTLSNCGLERHVFPPFDLVFLLSLFVGGLCHWSQQNCKEALCQAVYGVVVCSAGGGRDLLSDSNRKAFISSTCHDPGTASPALFLCENSQWKV